YEERCCGIHAGTHCLGSHERDRPERLEEIMKLFTNAQAKGRLDNWLERRHSDGIARRDILLEIVAIALDRGELPPKPLCEWAAKVLRGLIKDNARGTLLYRDACIAGLLIDLESWDFTLFPNPAGKRQGQVYGCDIVIEAFKKIDIDLTVDIIKNVWKEWSHRWAHHRRPLCS